MKKIPTMFARDWQGDRSRVLPQVHPGCEWVIAGEGVATHKLDGTSVCVQDGVLYKRRELHKGETEPAGFKQVDLDDETGKRIGYVAVGDGPEDRWHREAFAEMPPADWQDNTYELVGPKVQGNPEGYLRHTLVNHHAPILVIDEPIERTFDGIKAFLTRRDYEGIVFHHADGRMAKIKKKDFGLKR